MKHHFKVNESGAAIAAAAGMWNHPVSKDNLMTPPSEQFSFLAISNYPLGREAYVWFEGSCTCILFSTISGDGYSYIAALGGAKTASEQLKSPKFLIKNLHWAFVKDTSSSKTIREVNAVVRYEANKIKLAGGLINSGFPKGWKLDISSKTFSPSEVIRNLKS